MNPVRNGGVFCYTGGMDDPCHRRLEWSLLFAVWRWPRWVLVIAAFCLVLVAYGSFYSILVKRDIFIPNRSEPIAYWIPSYPHLTKRLPPAWGPRAARVLFWPAHQIDRLVRQK